MSAKKKKPVSRRSVASAKAAAASADVLELGAPLSEIAARLAFAAEGAVPSPSVKERLLARIRAQKAAAVVPAGWRFESANVEEGWRAAPFPGVRLKTLSVDEARDVVMLLIEMAPGSSFPDHPHDRADEGILLRGDVTTGGRLLRAGDYYYAAAGTQHNDIVSPSGCLALVSLSYQSWQHWRVALGSA
jgi:quercetin dioxygenase-like cupin family protein